MDLFKFDVRRHVYLNIFPHCHHHVFLWTFVVLPPACGEREPQKWILVIFRMVKVAGSKDWQPYYIQLPIVLKSGA